MFLTRQSSSRTPNDFPALQLFLLAVVRLSEPVALTSILPYAWSLVKKFHVGKEEDASFYAGILISAFSLAEAVMGMYWGSVSDRIGRKPVLLLGCAGTLFSMLAVGFSSNIWVALLGRVMGGLLNGNIGVIQTMVSEIVKRPEHEPRAFSIMPFVWSIGTIIGPFIGGTFSDPNESWPNVFPKGCLFDRFPYLLPNLICAGLMLISIVLGIWLLQETHPDMQTQVYQPVETYVSEETPLNRALDAMKQPAVDLRAEIYGTITHDNNSSIDSSTTYHFEKRSPPVFSMWTKPIIALLIALSIFTYHSMTYDHLMPIFFEDERATAKEMLQAGSFSLFYSPGGLGLSLRAVGMICAVNGLIALFVQAVIFPIVAERVGVYKLFLIVTVWHPVAYFIVPALLYTPESLLYPAIYTCLAVRNICSIMAYPLLLILIKEAVPSSSNLGKINGLAASAGATCRMIAPPVAGFLYTWGSKHDCTALAWYGSVVVALVGSFQCFFIPREQKLDMSEESGCIPPQPPCHIISEVSDDE